MSTEPKLCALCQHLRRGSVAEAPGWWLCGAPQARVRSVISGEHETPSCSSQRGSATGCGPDARFYEAANG